MNEKRGNERKKLTAFTPVYDSRQNILLGYLGDLTIQGAMVVGENPMEVNTQITLAIEFPETPKLPARRVAIPARVAWCSHEESLHSFKTGVEFQELNQEDKKIIEAILERYQYRR
jgi:Tfp pilus assembly protein PilZ